MSNVFIQWCGKSFVLLARVVLDPSLEEADRIRQVARRLNLPVVDGLTALQANDLWVGIGPEGGFGELAGETMWARSIEASLIPSRLEAAKVMTDRELLAAVVAKRSPRSVKDYRSVELILLNGRWGGCSGCPRDKQVVYPDRCGYTERYDHNIDSTKDGKFYSYNHEVLKSELIDILNS